MGRRVLALAVGLLLTVLLPGSALAESVVDQSNEAPGSWEGYSETIPLAQTFTVGMSGKLTGVDLRLKDDPGGSVHVSIETIGRQDRLPTGVVMVSADQSVTTAGWYHFSFPTGLGCLAGGRFAIVIEFGDAHSGASFVSTDKYPGGQALWKGAAWAPLGVGGDFAFRTYVDTAAPTSTPTLAPAPTPTPVPTATPTPAPTATLNPAPTASPKPTATASPKPTATASPKPTASAATASSAPTASVSTDPSNPTESPAATDSNALADLVVTSAPSARAGSNSGSGSNDSNGSVLPIAMAGIVVAGLLAGGLGFAFVRRRQPPSSPGGSEPGPDAPPGEG